MASATLGPDEVRIGNRSWRIPDPPAGLRRAVDLIHRSRNVHFLTICVDWLESNVMPMVVAGQNLDLRGTALQELADWIVESPSLDDITLRAYSNLQPSATLWEWIAATIRSKNQRGATKLKTLVLENVDVPAQVVALLIGDNPYLRNLYFKSTIIEQGSFPTEALAARHVAQSFPSNSTISELFFNVVQWDDAYLCAILQDLPNRNTTIDTLTLAGNMEGGIVSIAIPATVQSIVHFFQEAGRDGSTLRCVEFRDLFWSDEAMLSILRSLRGSPRQIQEVRMEECRMDNAAVNSKVLHSLFAADDDPETTTPSTLRTLSVQKQTWLRDRIHPDLIQNLVADSPNLHTLDLFDYDDELGIEGKRLLKAVFRGLQSPSCAVQTLKLGTLENRVRSLVIRCIPTFCSVTSFSMDEESAWNSPRWNEADKKKLMKAFRRNTRIVEVNVPSNFFDEADRARLQVYLERNRLLAPTIQAEALEVAKLVHREDGARRAVLLSRLLVLAARSDMPPSVFGAMVQVDQAVGL